LTWRIGLAPGAAREHVRVARALETLPLIAQALARGELSYSKVRALTRVATPETEERLLAVGRAGTAEHVERIVRGWRKVDRQAEAQEAAQRHKSQALHVYRDEDGMVAVRPRGGHTRSSWNVPAPGLRRQPGGHAPRPRRPPAGGRRPNAYDPTRSNLTLFCRRHHRGLDIHPRTSSRVGCSGCVWPHL
jgi:hypothetical protein